jgi:LmeA-like phospholipid-binding
VRGLRRLIVFLIVVAVLAVVADRVAEAVAENRLARLAADEAEKYDVRAADTSAEIGGFGFLPQLARGDFSRVTLTMDRPTVSSVPAQDVTAVMSGIQVPRELLTGGTGADVVVDSTDVRVRLSPQDLTRLAARTSGLDDMTLRITGSRLQAQVEVRGVDVAATVRPQVRGNRIRLLVDDLPGQPEVIRDAVNTLLSRGIEMPDLPFGATLKQVSVEGESVVVTATAAEIRLQP